jgi:hypothetical protein
MLPSRSNPVRRPTPKGISKMNPWQTKKCPERKRLDRNRDERGRGERGKGWIPDVEKLKRRVIG